MKGAIGHLKTITKHHNLVCRYCIRAGLICQGLTHDLSKLSPSEFLVGARYSAWLHHKGRNRHHYEYWIDYSADKNNPHVLAGAKMPRRYVAEMVFDRVSASRVYKGDAYTDRDPLEYFLRSRERSWYIHDVTKRQLEFLLRMWAEKGEEHTIGYIRYVFLAGENRYR